MHAYKQSSVKVGQVHSIYRQDIGSGKNFGNPCLGFNAATNLLAVHCSS